MKVDYIIFEKIAKKISDNKIERSFIVNCLNSGVSKEELENLFNNTKRYKNLLKNNNILITEELQNLNDKNYSKQFEKINDEIEKLIINNKAKKLMHSLFSNKYKELINEKTVDVFRGLIKAEVSRDLLEEGTFKKLKAFQSAEELNIHLEDKYLNTFDYNQIKSLSKNLGTKILSDENLFIVKIDNYEQMETLGSNMWCVQRSDRMFDEYTEYGDSFVMTFDFGKRKSDPLSQIATIIDSNGKVVEHYDSKDDLVKHKVLSLEIEKNTEKKSIKELIKLAEDNGVNLTRMAVRQNRIKEVELFRKKECNRKIVCDEIKTSIFDFEARGKQSLLKQLTKEEFKAMLRDSEDSFMSYGIEPEINKTLAYIIKDKELSKGLKDLIDGYNKEDGNLKYRCGEMLASAVYQKERENEDIIEDVMNIFPYSKEEKVGFLVSECLNEDITYGLKTPTIRNYLLKNHEKEFMNAVKEAEGTISQFLLNVKDSTRYIKRINLESNVLEEVVEDLMSNLTNRYKRSAEDKNKDIKKTLKIFDHLSVEKPKVSLSNFVSLVFNLMELKDKKSSNTLIDRIELLNENNSDYLNNQISRDLSTLINNKEFKNIETDFMVESVFKTKNETLIKEFEKAVEEKFEYSLNSRFQIEENHNFLLKIKENIDKEKGEDLSRKTELKTKRSLK